MGKVTLWLLQRRGWYRQGSGAGAGPCFNEGLQGAQGLLRGWVLGDALPSLPVAFCSRRARVCSVSRV